jgi:hypothetical protein
MTTSQSLSSFQWTPRDIENGIARVAWSPDGLVLLADNYPACATDLLAIAEALLAEAE